MKATLTIHATTEADLSRHLDNVHTTNATFVTVTAREFASGYAVAVISSPDLDAFCDAFDETDSIGSVGFVPARN